MNTHSFIDIAALDKVRANLFSGRAVFVLRADLQEIIWLNYAAAQLSNLDFPLLTPQKFPFDPLLMRQLHQHGYQSAPIGYDIDHNWYDFNIAPLTLPDGQPAAILTSIQIIDEDVESAIDALATQQTYAALFDYHGKIATSSDNFDVFYDRFKADIEHLQQTTTPTRNLVKALFREKDALATGAVLRLDDIGTAYLFIGGYETTTSSVATDKDKNSDTYNFSWRSNQNGQFYDMSEVANPQIAQFLKQFEGRTFDQIVAQFHLQHAETALAAFTRHHTWVADTLIWPSAPTMPTWHLQLAALPEFDVNRHFTGFRGFGILRLAQDEPIAHDAEPVLAQNTIAEASLFDTFENPTKTKLQSNNGLNENERNAFREIAARLQQDLASVSSSTQVTDHDASIVPEEEESVRDLIETPKLSQQQQQLIAQLPIAALVHREGTLLYANQAFLTLVGFHSLKELKAQYSNIDALFASDADSDAPLTLHTTTQPLAVNAHMQSIRLDNGARALLTTLTPYQQSIQTDADQTYDDFAAALDIINDGIVIMRADGRIENANHAALDLLSTGQQTLKGLYFNDFFDEENRIHLTHYLSRIMMRSSQAVFNDGLEITAHIGAQKQIALFITIGRLERSGHLCVIMRDMSDARNTENALRSQRDIAEENSRRKNSFLAQIAHEIRTPLNAIIGFADLMVNERFGALNNSRYHDYLRDINRSAHHILTLVNDLLDVTRIESGATNADLHAVDLTEVLEEIIAMMQPQAGKARIIMRSNIPAQLPAIRADQRMVKQIILNLLSNALHYTQAGGRIVITAHHNPADETVIIRIRDNGPGMDHHELEQALKPYGQVERHHDGQDDKRQTIGLGLPITQALAKANQAQFDLQSSRGQGTCAEVTFKIWTQA